MDFRESRLQKRRKNSCTGINFFNQYVDILLKLLRLFFGLYQIKFRNEELVFKPSVAASLYGIPPPPFTSHQYTNEIFVFIAVHSCSYIHQIFFTAHKNDWKCNFPMNLHVHLQICWLVCRLSFPSMSVSSTSNTPIEALSN